MTAIEEIRKTFACCEFSQSLTYRHCHQLWQLVQHSHSACREPARDLGPSMQQGACSQKQREMRASHDLRANLLTTNKMPGGQQLFGSNNLVVAGREQENWAPHYREINRAPERCAKRPVAS